MGFEQCRPRVGRTVALLLPHCLLLVPMVKGLTAWGLDEDVDSSSCQCQSSPALIASRELPVIPVLGWYCLSYTATAGLQCLCSHPLICLPLEGFSLCHTSSLHTVRDLIGTLRGLRITTVHLNFLSVPQDLLFFLNYSTSSLNL